MQLIGHLYIGLLALLVYYINCMKKFWFQLFGLIILISLATFLAFNQKYLTPLIKPFIQTSTTTQQTTNKRSPIRILGSDGTQKAQLSVEVANTKEKRSKGLGYRQSLASDSGMFFIHDSAQKYTYWMKGMEFPIDIIWIKDNEIKDIIPNIPPPVAGQTDDTLERYSSTVEVDRVLETNAGFVNKNNIQKGDKIVLENSD